MADNRHESNLPRELAAPARRALLGAGCTRLEDVAKMSEAEVMALHGIGPNAMKQLRRALAEQGLAFSEGKRNSA